MECSNNTAEAAEFQCNNEMPPIEGATELHDYVRERAEPARAEVAAWNARVEAWRSRHGQKPLAVKFFEQHPAAAMLASIIKQSGIVDDGGALELASRALHCTNAGLREMVEKGPQIAAQLLDLANLSSNQSASYARALLYGQLATVCGLLLDLRTTTSEEICGLPVHDIPGCILARTADVREGDDDA